MQHQKYHTDKTNEGQVQLSRLIFTHNWEDPSADEKALKIKEGDAVFTITSGGCNSLGFLRFNPSAIYCVDINPAQNYLMELKKAIFKDSDYSTCCNFLGLNSCNNRKEIFHSIKNNLSEEALQFWNEHPKIISNGMIMNGRYENFVKIAGKLLRML